MLFFRGTLVLFFVVDPELALILREAPPSESFARAFRESRVLGVTATVILWSVSRQGCMHDLVLTPYTTTVSSNCTCSLVYAGVPLNHALFIVADWHIKHPILAGHPQGDNCTYLLSLATPAFGVQAAGIFLHRSSDEAEVYGNEIYNMQGALWTTRAPRLPPSAPNVFSLKPLQWTELHIVSYVLLPVDFGVPRCSI